MKNIFAHKLLIIMALLFYSCTGSERRYVPEIDVDEKNKEAIIKINKYYVKQDAEIIAAYLERRNLAMTETNTGLWYQIYETGAGSKVETGDVVKFDYKIELLDGTMCYSSDSLGMKTFTVGSGGVEAGLEEGILLLHKGDKARFIMPPHLAYGLIGDQNKIPKRAIIVYYIELQEVRKNE